MGSLQCLKLHQAARSAWGLGLTAREQGRTAAGRLPEGGRSPILTLKEALKDTLRLMFLDRFQQLLKINQRFLRDHLDKSFLTPVARVGGPRDV